MSSGIGRVYARIKRWLWGNPQQQTPEEIRDAAHNVLNAATALTALVEKIHREERERKEWTSSPQGN